MPRSGLQRKCAAAALEPGQPSRAQSANTRHATSWPHTLPADRMYATDIRQTDVRQHHHLMPTGLRHNNKQIGQTEHQVNNFNKQIQLSYLKHSLHKVHKAFLNVVVTTKIQFWFDCIQCTKQHLMRFDFGATFMQLLMSSYHFTMTSLHRCNSWFNSNGQTIRLLSSDTAAQPLLQAWQKAYSCRDEKRKSQTKRLYQWCLSNWCSWCWYINCETKIWSFTLAITTGRLLEKWTPIFRHKSSNGRSAFKSQSNWIQIVDVITTLNTCILLTKWLLCQQRPQLSKLHIEQLKELHNTRKTYAVTVVINSDKRP